jgi:hypothetical protein
LVQQILDGPHGKHTALPQEPVLHLAVRQCLTADANAQRILDTLLATGRANLALRNSRGQTPLQVLELDSQPLLLDPAVEPRVALTRTKLL